jgi:hypothetical protein
MRFRGVDARQRGECADRSGLRVDDSGTFRQLEPAIQGRHIHGQAIHAHSAVQKRAHNVHGFLRPRQPIDRNTGDGIKARRS